MQTKPIGNKLNKRTLLSLVLIVFLIPATIWFGIHFLNDRSYYFISLLIVIYTTIPFFMVFENRKPQARELIILAVMVAIAVAGRAAFFMIPQFKPVTAIVIIAGVCMGAESGFLVGSMTAFVSNFFFGQGPWTPWQMFSFGIIGFIAGILFKKGRLKKNKLSLCIYGGISTIVVYGGIMNISSVMMMSPKLNIPILIAAYSTGIWFDLIHAFATVIFLYFISDSMIEKLDRVRFKYGLMYRDYE